MKNVIGIVIFFVTGIILGGGILQLTLIPSILLGAVCYTIYQALVAKDIALPIILWIVIGIGAIFAWLMF